MLPCAIISFLIGILGLVWSLWTAEMSGNKKIFILLGIAVGLCCSAGIYDTASYIKDITAYNKLINTPAQISQMISEMNYYSEDEKEIINEQIRKYNNEIGRFHLDHLGEERSAKEEEVFNLQPIMEIE